MSTKVKLRKKPISRKRSSLYLDFYPPIPDPNTGESTRREFLKLYIFDKPKSVIDKLHNKDTIQLAEQIRQKRENLIVKSIQNDHRFPFQTDHPIPRTVTT